VAKKPPLHVTVHERTMSQPPGFPVGSSHFGSLEPTSFRSGLCAFSTLLCGAWFTVVFRIVSMD